MGIGKLRCHVIDVDDLGVAEAFWSEVTGLSVIGSAIDQIVASDDGDDHHWRVVAGRTPA